VGISVTADHHFGTALYLYGICNLYGILVV